MLLDNFILVDLKQYEGRHRRYVKDTSQVFSNAGNTIEYTPFIIEAASIQPVSGWTMQSLPEGYRSKAQYTFWTKTDIISLKQGTDNLSDQILIDGEWYSIFTRGDWTRTSFLPHTECIAIWDDQNNTYDYDGGGGNFG